MLVMTHKEFLEKLGSARQAAEAFGVTHLDIGHWKTRGIPARYWVNAEAIASKHGIAVTALSLSITKPSALQRKAAA